MLRQTRILILCFLHFHLFFICGFGLKSCAFTLPLIHLGLCIEILSQGISCLILTGMMLRLKLQTLDCQCFIRKVSWWVFWFEILFGFCWLLVISGGRLLSFCIFTFSLIHFWIDHWVLLDFVRTVVDCFDFSIIDFLRYICYLWFVLVFHYLLICVDYFCWLSLQLIVFLIKDLSHIY